MNMNKFNNCTVLCFMSACTAYNSKVSF